MAEVLTRQAEDFPQWYQDVLNKAELADNGPARGTMIIRPYGYGIWERMQADLDRRIKRAGAQNAYFPVLIPLSYLQREAEHVEKFSPELAVVTHGGGEQLAEPLAVRPTSETVINVFMAKWIHSYRDLPLLLNQWANVVRWELRPRAFLRTAEFLWQEGHTAHATEEDARAYALRIATEVYRDFMAEVLAIPVFVGRKTRRERFGGATNSITCEALMRDGKALQMGTSHELGQRFAQAFDVAFQDSAGRRQFAWTTSWGVSTRLVGGLIMAHGDDRGLRLPPAAAPAQVVLMAVTADAGAAAALDAIGAGLEAAGVRGHRDLRVDVSYGRRAVDWELKGVPVRLVVGPRELAAGQCAVTRRDTGATEKVALGEAAARCRALLGEIQRDMLAAATAERDARVVRAATVAEALAVAETGVARIPWSAVGEAGETALNERGVTVRCLQAADGSVPASEDEEGVEALVARAY